MRLKTVRVPRGYEGLHCEVAGCIVNIHVGLSDDAGRRVTRISIKPDQYAGEPRWTVEGQGEIRIIEDTQAEKP